MSVKPKNIAISAIAGFLLSFFISIIATHNFGWSAMRGGIFAVVFGALAVGVDVVSGKFLALDDSSFVSSSESRPTVPDGTHLDITISDASLTDDKDGPQFRVSGNRHSFVPDETSEAQKTPRPSVQQSASVRPAPDETPAAAPAPKESPAPAAAQPSAGSFQPVNLAQTAQSVDASSAESAAEAEKPTGKKAAALARKAALAAEREAEAKEIGALPDLMEYSSDSKEDDEDLIEDSDFAQYGDSEPNSHADSSGQSKEMSEDVDTMAKAIRTLLKQDD